MDVTFLGQAGLFLKTRGGSILCDPWFSPAYFASWFPFPSSEGVDRAAISSPDYLYVSHQHFDHFDPRFIREYVSKDATVLLPDFPLDSLERALRDLGFTSFLRLPHAQVVEHRGLRLMCLAMVAPVDGPLGDSGLLVDDGEMRIFDQNDSRPIDFDAIGAFGALDAHFLQFSGAIWYPMVYQYPEKMMQALGRKKRENELARALRYAQQVGARFVVPSAGPPCFLDDDLFALNDFDRDPANTFPDQTVFIEYMQANGLENGRLMIPGSVAHLTEGEMSVAHPLPDEEVRAIFTQKRAYLTAYQERMRPLIEAERATWPHPEVDILAELTEWFEPLLAQADIISAGINGRILLDCDRVQVALDFHTRKVYAWDGGEWDYRFHIAAPLIESCIVRHEVDWVNALLLSCRFEAERKGAYNEYVYTFFKCLSPERMAYAEGYWAEQVPEHQFWESHGYRIQRRCPHLKADLTRFSQIEDGILTCTLHGWQFELESGRCLTSDDRHLYTAPLAQPQEVAAMEAQAQQATNSVSAKCHDCWYKPSDLPAPTPAGRTERDK